MSTDKSRALLIVEDDLALQKQIKWSLDRFESVTATTARARWCRCAGTSPAVVTMDLGLPPDPDSVSEGFKLLEQMLAADPDVKVIVLTGQNDQANALRAVALGAYDFFAKPFEPECAEPDGRARVPPGRTAGREPRLQAMQPARRAGRPDDARPGMLRSAARSRRSPAATPP
jgi:two-component system NtrC family response regulator